MILIRSSSVIITKRITAAELTKTSTNGRRPVEMRLDNIARTQHKREIYTYTMGSSCVRTFINGYLSVL